MSVSSRMNILSVHDDAVVTSTLRQWMAGSWAAPAGPDRPCKIPSINKNYGFLAPLLQRYIRVNPLFSLLYGEYYGSRYSIWAGTPLPMGYTSCKDDLMPCSLYILFLFGLYLVAQLFLCNVVPSGVLYRISNCTVYISGVNFVLIKTTVTLLAFMLSKKNER